MELNKFEKQMQELREHPELRIPEHRRDVMLQEIVTWNGDKKQHIIVMEELAELIQQVSKYLRYGETKYNRTALLEEMADVAIGLEMLRYMHNIPEYEFADAVQVKLEVALEKARREE